MNTRSITRAAVIAALYVLLTVGQDLLFPGSASNAIQFRAAEALCVLALFTPDAIFGLSLGCLIFNLTNAGALPLDWFVGTVATLLAAIFSYRLRHVRVLRLPLPALLMPVAFNAVLVGCELTIYIPELPLWLNMLYVAVGEAGVMLTLGSALYFALRARGLDRRLFS